MRKNTQSVAVNNPLTGRLSFVTLKMGQNLGTKVPFLLFSKHVLESYDLIYSSFEVDERNSILPGGRLREVTYITGYTKEDVQEVIAAITSCTDSIALTAYKYPDCEDYPPLPAGDPLLGEEPDPNDYPVCPDHSQHGEYALPWSDAVIDKLMPDPPRTIYKEYYKNAVAEGRVKTKTEMLADGWV